MHVETIGDATLYLGDCLQVLPSVGPVDCVITDPPFEAEAHTAQRRALGRGSEDGRRDIQDASLPFAVITEAERMGLCTWAAERCAGWVLAFCQAEAIGLWRASLEAAGAKWRRAGIWVKPDGMPQFSGDRPGMGHESIAMGWCGKGASRWNGGGRHGVWIVPKHDSGQGHGGRANDHPTQKPFRLMSELVAAFSDEGQLVCDPFMGSGTTGAACASLGRRFVGVEVNPAYFALACERIRAAYQQVRLFA
jgi:site-specific DNA-methyltransferase (adenine-specific)